MKFNDSEYEVQSGETVLDILTRHQHDINFSCKSGICQSCLLQALQGDIDAKAQKGLKDTAIAQGYFLSCQQQAQSIQHVRAVDSMALFSRGQLIEKTLFSNDICRIRVEPVNPLYYHSGQFVNLKNPGGVVRSYSLASLPAKEEFLEFHIQRKTGGVFSNWVFDSLELGQSVDFQGPIGNCFYLNGNQNNPLILIGTGTGAAPLWGIVRDAIHSGHTGDIHFYHGGRGISSLYLDAELRSLQEDVPNFFYHPSISSGAVPKFIEKGRCNELALAAVDEYKDGVFYLCGNADMVSSTKKNLYLSGIALAKIHADPFEYKELRQTPRA